MKLTPLGNTERVYRGRPGLIDLATISLHELFQLKFCLLFWDGRLGHYDWKAIMLVFGMTGREHHQATYRS